MTRLLSIVVAVLLVGAACDRGAQRDTESATATGAAATGASDSATTASDEPPVPADEKAETGDKCNRDADCRTYYRCYDEQCIVPPAMTGEVREDTPVASISKGGEVRAKFNLELAVSLPEKTRGLMFRRSMKDDWGMLFVYPNDGPRSFWMKDTLIPLDMVFIASNGEVVHVIEGAEPMTLTPRRSPEPARYVLELNAGIAKKKGVEPGTVMTLENAPDDVQTKP